MQPSKLEVLTNNPHSIQRPEFKCPYANKELRRPCEVGSCSFNLADNQISRSFKRCFLNYQDSLRYNPYSVAKDKDFDFNSLSQTQKNQVVAAFFEVPSSDLDRVTSEFHSNLFAVMIEDTLVGLTKVCFSPVPYRQCAVCGSETDELHYPHGVLPDGIGYCSYACYQLKPPPIIVVERNLEVDFLSLVKALSADSTQSKPVFARQIVEWVLSSTPMR